MKNKASLIHRVYHTKYLITGEVILGVLFLFFFGIGTIFLLIALYHKLLQDTIKIGDNEIIRERKFLSTSFEKHKFTNVLEADVSISQNVLERIFGAKKILVKVYIRRGINESVPEFYSFRVDASHAEDLLEDVEKIVSKNKVKI